MQDLPVKNYERAKPQLLLGLDHVHLGITTATVQGSKNQPIAVKTTLGWLVYGPSYLSMTIPPIVLHMRENYNLSELNNIVSDYLAADVCKDTPLLTIESAEDTKARDILEKTAKFNGPLYEIGLLWNHKPTTVPDNLSAAIFRLLGGERNMQ